MHQLALGLAVLLALGIILIGGLYVSRPLAMARSFGLPLPQAGPHVESWLRLKGVRDIASGLIVLAAMIWAGSGVAGLILLVATMIPLGDMLVVLGGKGSTRSAFGIHGVTALVMLLAAVPLASGSPR